MWMMISQRHFDRTQVVVAGLVVLWLWRCWWLTHETIELHVWPLPVCPLCSSGYKFGEMNVDEELFDIDTLYVKHKCFLYKTI